MTPKERANKLRYQIESAMQDADMRGHYNQAVKGCALIAVDQIILEQCKSSELKDPRYQDERINYWNEVKKELESYYE